MAGPGDFLSGYAAVAQIGSPPYTIGETSAGYALWRVIAGVPTRITPAPVVGTETDEIMTTPRLSPDGSKIAFDWNWPKADFSGAIAIVDANGGTPSYVTPDDGGAKTFAHPSWHPDGDSLLYVYADANTLPGGEIYSVDITGSGTPALLWTPQTQSPNQQEGAFRPYYSPDGTKIAFIVNVNSTAGGADLSRQGLWVMDADGSNASLIDAFDTSQGNGGYGKTGTQLAWAHGSNVIAYSSGGFANTVREIFKINADGTGKTQLSNGLAAGLRSRLAYNAWLADDSGVIASIQDGLTVRVWFLSADGATQTKLNASVGPATASSGQFSNGYRNTDDDRIYFIEDDTPATVSSFAIDGTDYRVDHDASGITTGFVGGEGFEWA